jgi:hypothetical protein
MRERRCDSVRFSVLKLKLYLTVLCAIICGRFKRKLSGRRHYHKWQPGGVVRPAAIFLNFIRAVKIT